MVNIRNEIKEAFEVRANEIGFCLDQRWGQYENPYTNNDTALAYNLFKDGWTAANNIRDEELNGFVVVPKEPTPKMIDSTWNDQDEIETMSHNERNEFIYKKMIQVAMVESARAEMSRSDLWCVAIRPECDSHFEQCPAASKELAEKAVARYKSMNEKEGNEFVLEIFDYCFEVQVWEGSEEDHAKEMFYTESWFSEAMYWCDSLEMAERVFKFGEIVDCHKKGFPILKTSDFEKAKRFYEESKTDAEES